MPNVNENLSDVLRDCEIDDVLRATFYSGAPAANEHEPAPEARPKPKRAGKPKPDHYEVICISLYKEDLERLDAKVQELKNGGHRKMTRSGLIRFALDQVDVRRMPRAY